MTERETDGNITENEESEKYILNILWINEKY